MNQTACAPATGAASAAHAPARSRTAAGTPGSNAGTVCAGSRVTPAVVLAEGRQPGQLTEVGGTGRATAEHGHSKQRCYGDLGYLGNSLESRQRDHRQRKAVGVAEQGAAIAGSTDELPALRAGKVACLEHCSSNLAHAPLVRIVPRILATIMA